MKDHYKILNIPRDADDAVIKKAYKAAALRFHPDVNKNADAAEKFIAANEAYETLIDHQSRIIYDTNFVNDNFYRPTGNEQRRPQSDNYRPPFVDDNIPYADGVRGTEDDNGIREPETKLDVGSFFWRLVYWGIAAMLLHGLKDMLHDAGILK